jgi:cytochrome P450
MTSDVRDATGADSDVAGRYDPLSPAAKHDPESQWNVLQDTVGVHHFVLPEEAVAEISDNPLAAQPTTEFWSALKYEDVLHVVTNPRSYLSKDGPGPEFMISMVEEGVLLFADAPAHLRQRRLAAKAFTPRSVDRLAEPLQVLVDSLIDNIAAKGSMEILDDLSFPMAIQAITSVMGIPDARADDFRRWGNAIVGAFGGDGDSRDEGMEALGDLFECVADLIAAIRAGTEAEIDPALSEGVLAALVRAEVDGTTLLDEEILFMTMQLVTAGYETTSTAIASGIYLLCTHPEQRAIVEADPEMYKPAVEEILRFMSPLEGLFRTTAEDVELGGCPVPHGSKVRACFAAANRDGRKFQDADKFDILRDPEELKGHLAFGHGPHACIGASLARMELRRALETVFRRLPGLELDPDRPPTRNTALVINGFRDVHVRWDPSRVQPAS